MMREKTFAERWEERQERWDKFRPTKPLWFWSCIGAAAVTVALGFTVGGWTTRQAAERLAHQAVEDSRAQLVAVVCAQKLGASSNFGSDVSALDSAGAGEPLESSATLCADELMKLPHSSVPVAGSPGEPST